MKKLLFCIGTRPEAIKLAPLIIAAKALGAEARVLTTGQHRDMLKPFIELFKIDVHHALDVLKPNQSLSNLTASIINAVQPVIQSERPDFVITQGDTTTAFASSLAAFYEKTSVVHIEAGLRTFDRYSPFPEEMNRKLIGSIASFHFAPTACAEQNLKREGIVENVYVTGNTGVDALRITLEKLGVRAPLGGIKQILVTCHRRENHGEPLNQICAAILKIVQAHPDTIVLFPVHLNPNIQKTVTDLLGKQERITLCEPLGYEEFSKHMQDSYLLLTDSGGVQEEAPYLKKPIFVLRESTERPEGVEAGVSKLVGSDPDLIFSEVSKALTDPAYYAQFQKAVSPYGDGHASEKILRVLLETQP